MAPSNRLGLDEDSLAWRKADCHKKHEAELPVTENPIRAFDPSRNRLYRGEMSDILEPCYGCAEYHLRVTTPGKPRDIDPCGLAVFIDGACRDNGRSYARASIGVFFGPGSERNYGCILGSRIQFTNQVAEISAAINAIRDTRSWYPEEEKKICKLLIVTDSKYLVEGISDYIWKWKRNGWRNARGEPVHNQELFQELDGLVSEMEEEGIEVCFWHVRRELNGEADRLANEALDRG